jgi:hypothetical protein
MLFPHPALIDYTKIDFKSTAAINIIKDQRNVSKGLICRSKAIK